MIKAGLPAAGQVPFVPKIVTSPHGKHHVARAAVRYGPRKGKVGYVDASDRIWVRDYAHGGRPNHWDVQENGGRTYFRVDDNGYDLP